MTIQLPNHLVIAACRVEVPDCPPERLWRPSVIDGIAMPVRRHPPGHVTIAEQIVPAVRDGVGSRRCLGRCTGETSLNDAEPGDREWRRRPATPTTSNRNDGRAGDARSGSPRGLPHSAHRSAGWRSQGQASTRAALASIAAPRPRGVRAGPPCGPSQRRRKRSSSPSIVASRRALDVRLMRRRRREGRAARQVAIERKPPHTNRCPLIAGAALARRAGQARRERGVFDQAPHGVRGPLIVVAGHEQAVHIAREDRGHTAGVASRRPRSRSRRLRARTRACCRCPGVWR